MATKALAVPQSLSATVQVQDQITSLKDGAYKQAVASDKMRGVARYVLTTCKGFPDDVSDEVKEQLYDGYRLRFNETNPAKRYAIVNDHYLLIDGSNPDLEKEKEVALIGTDYVFAFSQQEYGKLKTSDPYKHAVIKEWRDKITTYCSNRLGDLKRQARTILNEGKQKERGATLDFGQRVVETFKGDQGLIQKCKNASKRGDTTADEKRLKLSIDAFMVQWNK